MLTGSMLQVFAALIKTAEQPTFFWCFPEVSNKTHCLLKYRIYFAEMI